MLENLGFALTALGVVGIPLTSWLIRRATHEGRLTLCIERLGNVYALMPDSPEKLAFEPHLTAAIKRLNDWLKPHARKRRGLMALFRIGFFVIGIVIAYFVDTSFVDGTVPWEGPAIGAVIGLMITLALQLIQWQLDARSALKAERDRESERIAAADLRMKAFSMGAPIPASFGDGETLA